MPNPDHTHHHWMPNIPDLLLDDRKVLDWVTNHPMSNFGPRGEPDKSLANMSQAAKDYYELASQLTGVSGVEHITMVDKSEAKAILNKMYGRGVGALPLQENTAGPLILEDFDRVGALPLQGKKINRFDPIDFAAKHVQSEPFPMGSGHHWQLVFKDGQRVEKVGGIITLDDIKLAIDNLTVLQRTIEGSGANDQVANNIAKVIALPEGRVGSFILPPEG